MNNCPLTGKPCPNPKSIHVTDIIDGEISEMHLCQSCGTPSPGLIVLNFIEKMLTQLPKKTCPSCKISINDIKLTGRLGCEKCYSHFKEELTPVLQHSHNSTQHIGKSPRKLEQKLAELVAQERYEEAAVIRDKIKSLKNEPQAPPSS